MDAHLIFWPVLAVLTLTGALGVRLFLARSKAVRAGEVSFKFYKGFRDGEEPEAVHNQRRAFLNLMETPPLFYVVCISFYVLEGVTPVVLGFAALYTVLRFAQTIVHCSSNKVPIRAYCFLGNMSALFVMIILLAVHLIQMG